MSEIQFQVGDLVTRDGTDVHRITEIDDEQFSLRVICIKAPLTGWCKIGDVESNLVRRYDHAGDTIENRLQLPTG